jgi:hypothetical protein
MKLLKSRPNGVNCCPGLVSRASDHSGTGRELYCEVKYDLDTSMTYGVLSRKASTLQCSNIFLSLSTSPDDITNLSQNNDTSAGTHVIQER